MEVWECQLEARKMAKPMCLLLTPRPPVFSQCVQMWSPVIKGEEEVEGFYRSETEPSEVQDQPTMKAEAVPDGHQKTRKMAINPLTVVKAESQPHARKLTNS